MPSESLRILFVINKRSGRKKGVDWQATIKQHFANTHHELHYFVMPRRNCEPLLKDRITKLKPDIITAVGGDGTVNLVARQVLNRPIQMAIVPAGSANGMARELGISDDPEKALEVVTTGIEKSTDAVSINDTEICLHLSDMGLNAQLIKYFQEGPVRGFLGYTFALIKALYRRRKIRVQIQTRTEQVERGAYMVLIANASKYGTGAIINPGSSIHDGLFEVVIVRRLNFIEILKTFLHFRRFNPRKIEVLQATAVNIETRRKMHFQVDGEYRGKINKLNARILPGQLRLIVPRPGA